MSNHQSRPHRHNGRELSKNPFESATSSLKQGLNNPFDSDSSSVDSSSVRDYPMSRGGLERQSVEDAASSQERVMRRVQSEATFSRPLNGNTKSNSASGSLENVQTERAPSPLVPQIHVCQANLAAVMNDPRRRARMADLDLFTRTWGSYFIPRPIPPLPKKLSDIPIEKFIPYLQFLKEPWKNRRTNAKEVAVTTRTRQLSLDEVDIPPTFVDPNFCLENPDTFAAVLPMSQFEIGGSGSGSSSAHLPQRSTKLLQEKLSHVLDKVEMQLAEQVAAKSDIFFQTISSQERLNEGSRHIQSEIRAVRAKLRAVNNGVNKNSLRLLQLHRLRHNYSKCYEKLSLMATVHQTQPTIQLLLSTSDFVGALDLITTTQEVLHAELDGVKSFRHLGLQLCEMERMIGNMIQNDFVKFTLSTLTLETKSDGEVEQERDRIVSVLNGLLRRKNITFLSTYKDESCTMMRARIKKIIADHLTAEGTCDMKMEDQIRLLPVIKWLDLLSKVFEGTVALIQKMEQTHKLISCVLHSASEQAGSLESDVISIERIKDQPEEGVPLLSAGEYERLVTESVNVVTSTCEIAHSQCAKLITHRQREETSEQLNQADHFMLSRMVERFVGQCETATTKPCNSLRAILVSQSRDLVNQFHQERLTNIRLLLENERWVVADVPSDFQKMVSQIVADKPPREVLARQPSGDRDVAPRRTLLFYGKEYIVTGTVLLVMKIVVEYCNCLSDVPGMSTDILTKVVENLKAFNETTCQLILCAGALRNIGLKTITAKHLGVASQSMSVILQMLPWVRMIFSQYLPQRQHVMLSQLEHLATDYSDHINQIFSKLINIMGEVYQTYLASWQPKPPTPSLAITSITRQTLKMHEALAAILHPKEIQTVFKGVFVLFRKYFELQLDRHGLMNSGMKHGIVGAELAYFTDSINCLDFVGDTDDIFHDIGTR